MPGQLTRIRVEVDNLVDAFLSDVEVGVERLVGARWEHYFSASRGPGTLVRKAGMTGNPIFVERLGAGARALRGQSVRAFLRVRGLVDATVAVVLETETA